MLRPRIDPRPAGRRAEYRSAAPAWVFAAFGAIAVTMYGIGPAGLAMPAFVAVAIGSITATVIGTLRHGMPGTRRPWWAMVAAQALFLGGVILRATVPGAYANPPSPAVFVPDLLVVPGYLLVGYGLIDLLRRRARVTTTRPAPTR
jgi:hypothetical protein